MIDDDDDDGDDGDDYGGYDDLILLFHIPQKHSLHIYIIKGQQDKA